MTFRELCRVADETVKTARLRLPPEIAPLADRVPVTYEPWPSEAMLEDENVEPDILGLFVGPDLAHAGDSATGPPPQILLFVENIWDFAEADLATYRNEVRITYFHELGHYLGWGEDELALRGLD
jgi:predicted Zn-dependent protease with MMP-like domain